VTSLQREVKAYQTFLRYWRFIDSSITAITKNFMFDFYK
jgi:hypothetical protein